MKNLTTVQKVGKVLLVLVSIMMISGSFGMIFANPDSKDAIIFAPLHLGNYIHILGIIKLFIGIFLLLPITRRIAALVGTAYLGGAIMATLTIGMFPFIAGAALLILWISIELLSQDFLHMCTYSKNLKNIA